MATVIVSIHPKEVETLKEEIDLVGFPTITFHSMVTLEMRPDKAASKPSSKYVLMICYSVDDILASKGRLVDFVTDKAQADKLMKEYYNEVYTGQWEIERITGKVCRGCDTHENGTGYIYLIPID